MSFIINSYKLGKYSKSILSCSSLDIVKIKTLSRGFKIKFLILYQKLIFYISNFLTLSLSIWSQISSTLFEFSTKSDYSSSEIQASYKTAILSPIILRNSLASLNDSIPFTLLMTNLKFACFLNKQSKISLYLENDSLSIV